MNQYGWVAVGLGCTLSWGACRSAGTGTAVSLGTLPPPPGCTEVGSITGRGAEARAATADLRQQAAKLGATYVRHEAPTGTGTLTGVAFRCDLRNVPEDVAEPQKPRADAAVAEAAPPPDKAAVEVAKPTGAGGFKFGETLAGVTERCTGAGHVFKERGSGYYLCSALPQNVGHPADATLWLRDDALVLIRLTVTPKAADPATWLEAYDGFASAIEGKYGAPKSAQRAVPAECEGKALASCLKDGKLMFSSLWEFSDSLRIELSLGKGKDRPETAIRLLYDQSGPRPKSTVADAL